MIILPYGVLFPILNLKMNLLPRFEMDKESYSRKIFNSAILYRQFFRVNVFICYMFLHIN